jgi:predicted transcriptional regulator
MNAAASQPGLAKPPRTLRRIISGDKQALRPDDTLRSAGNQMRSLHAGAWPVVKDRMIVGVIHGPDPDWRAQRFGHDPEKSTVSACMHYDVERCYDDEDCVEALDFMLSHDLRYVAVTDHEEHFLGIVSLEEILSALAGAGVKREALKH